MTLISPLLLFAYSEKYSATHKYLYLNPQTKKTVSSSVSLALSLVIVTVTLTEVVVVVTACMHSWCRLVCYWTVAVGWACSGNWSQKCWPGSFVGLESFVDREILAVVVRVVLCCFQRAGS
jgi:hypothetical protein